MTTAITDAMVFIPGGESHMGSDDHYLEEAPRHRVRVDGFWLDRAPVTNRQFAEFVDAAGYATDAERPPPAAAYPGVPAEQRLAGSAVFTAPSGPVDLAVPTWWRYAPGASWRAPWGPGSSIEELIDHPVVHVSHADADAYAAWAGKRLATEAEWEHAAREGRDEDARWDDLGYTRLHANVWPGDFPVLPEGARAGTTAVGSFPANALGAVDMIGNVWEWTADWFDEGHRVDRPCCVRANPRGPEPPPDDPLARGGSLRVVKGGSFLCAPNYCSRYRPAARIPQASDSGASNVGFRCALTAR